MLAASPSAISPQSSVWLPLRSLSPPLPSRPAKAQPYLTAYGKHGHRASDHRAEYPSAAWMRHSYAKRQAFNCDNTLCFLNSSDGFWHLYDARTKAYLKRLSGPAGDNAEMQWDKSDPHVLYYGGVNGGTAIIRLDVSTNTHTTQYDFAAAVRALWPTAEHCWSGSEGSPSVDGRLWGFKAEDANFRCLGFFVMDIFARVIVWHQDAQHGRPDFVSVSPSGRSFLVGGDDLGMYIVHLDGSRAPALVKRASAGRVPLQGTQKRGQVAGKQPLPHVEHADTFVLASGGDGLATIDYESNDGDLFWIDMDDPNLIRTVFDHAYHNPLYGENYAWHFSGRATRKPGFLVCSNVGSPPCNMYVLKQATGQKFAFGANYAQRGDYFDEAHACPSSDLSLVMHNDNYGTSLDIDAYIVEIPKIN
jgi:WD40 repeat protein